MNQLPPTAERDLQLGEQFCDGDPSFHLNGMARGKEIPSPRLEEGHMGGIVREVL